MICIYPLAMAQRSESRVKYIWTLPSEQAILKRSLIMARATISFISVMLTKLVISNCSDCRGLFHIAHEWHGLSQIFLLRRWFIALSLSLQNKSFPCFLPTGKTHYNFINHYNLFLSDNQNFVSRRSRESHEGCIAKGSQLSALPSVYHPDG